MSNDKVEVNILKKENKNLNQEKNTIDAFPI